MKQVKQHFVDSSGLIPKSNFQETFLYAVI